jgi:hypothetical protein
MGNVMSGKNDKKKAQNRMYCDFANFGQGNFTKKNVGIVGEFTDVSDCNSPSVKKPSFGKDYGPKKLSTHKYNATVNQCAVDGSNQFFMKMRLKPYKIYGNGTKGTESQKGETFNFLTSKCGTNDKIDFSITPTPASALTTVIPQAKARSASSAVAVQAVNEGSRATSPSKASKAPNPSKGCKATNPSKGSKAPNPSKGSKAPKPSKGSKASSVSNEPSLSPTVECDVKDFDDLQRAIIDSNGDIKLCSGEIIFTEQIILTAGGKDLTFTCPNGDCKLNANSNSRFFFIEEGTSNTSFDGIIFKNGAAGVSPQYIVVLSSKDSTAYSTN